MYFFCAISVCRAVEPGAAECGGPSGLQQPLQAVPTTMAAPTAAPQHEPTAGCGAATPRDSPTNIITAVEFVSPRFWTDSGPKAGFVCPSPRRPRLTAMITAPPTVVSPQGSQPASPASAGQQFATLAGTLSPLGAPPWTPQPSLTVSGGSRSQSAPPAGTPPPPDFSALSASPNIPAANADDSVNTSYGDLNTPKMPDDQGDK